MVCFEFLCGDSLLDDFYVEVVLLGFDSLPSTQIRVLPTQTAASRNHTEVL